MSAAADNVRCVLTTLAARDEFGVHQWSCGGEDAVWSDPVWSDPAWSDTEQPTAARLVLVRSGRFRRQSDTGGPVDHDSTIGYLGAPGEHERFAHPHGGDRCTSVQISAPSWAQMVGDPGFLRQSAVYIDARLDFAHRRLLGACSHDPDFRLAEEVLRLVGVAVERAADRRIPLHDRPIPADRRVVDRARSALHDRHPAARGLFPLAALLDVSPYRLSRAFTRELGVSITGYRNRIRIGHALDGLQRAEVPLADLAVMLGFADQAHFTRTVRAQLGCTPTAVRHALTVRAG